MSSYFLRRMVQLTSHAAKKPFSIVAAGPENIPPSQGDLASALSTKPALPGTPKRRKSVSHYEVGGGSPSKRRELEPLRIEFTPGGMEAFGQGLEKTLFANKTNSKVVADPEGRAPVGRGRPKGKGKSKAIEGKAKAKGVKRTASSVDTPRRAKAAPPTNKRKVEVSLKPSKPKRAASTVGVRNSQRTRQEVDEDVEVDVFS